jgi:hypothetical protein
MRRANPPMAQHPVRMLRQPRAIYAPASQALRNASAGGAASARSVR